MSASIQSRGFERLPLWPKQWVSSNPKDQPQMPVIVETLEGLQRLKDMPVNSDAWSATPRSARSGVSVKGRRHINEGGHCKTSATV